ncbi:MAG: hypothetical protein M1817_003306 [Caeruleum heppii]|nr:MAG: hypothetical protein M1817_003306 [Caeruleum heppii]
MLGAVSLSHCLLLACVGLVKVTEAAFDRSAPPASVENFDPAEADPRANITCLGPLPDWRIPAVRGADPNTFTLQELCAKPQYGGRGPHQHLGGWCVPEALPTHLRHLSFDRSMQSSHSTIWSDVIRHHASTLLDHPLDPPSAVPYLTNSPYGYDRLLLYCKQRCFCNQDVVDRSVRPYVNVIDSSLFLMGPRNSPQVSLHLLPFARYPVPMGNMLLGESIDIQQQITEPAKGVPEWNPVDVSLDPQNRVVCTGDLPTWVLPLHPASPDDFRDGETNPNQRLCAVRLNDGHPYANAGSYCHPNQDGTAEVSFSDEMTPRTEWTWPNLQVSLEIRRHCYQNCACVGNKKSRDTFGSIFRMAENLHLIMPSHHRPGTETATDPSAQSAAPARVAPPSAGSCGAYGRQFCPTPWPSAVFGPKPMAPYELSSSTSGAAAEPTDVASKPKLPTCGASCVSNAQCRSSPEAPSNCRCMAIGEAVAKTLGADPVFPFGAACLLFYEGLKGALDRYAKGLPKRGDMPDESRNETSETWACACNATYVSRACCESEVGMVWEDADFKLGRLIE